jgi:cation efflux family protein
MGSEPGSQLLCKDYLTRRLVSWRHPMREHGHHQPDHGSHSAGHGHSHGGIDPSLVSNARGLWAVKWSFLGLFITAVLQLAVVMLSGSVALLADTIHNFGDAATGVPLAVAFLFANRPPNQRFQYGTGGLKTWQGSRWCSRYWSAL